MRQERARAMTKKSWGQKALLRRETWQVYNREEAENGDMAYESDLKRRALLCCSMRSD